MTAKAARRRLQPAERREMILEEALRLFAARHYSVVTVRDIAMVCGINVGLLYHYFDNKDDLVRRALGHAIEQLMVGFEERRVSTGGPRDEIRAWLETHISFASTTALMVKLMSDHASAGTGDPEVEAMIAGFYDREKALLEDALRRGIAAGEFGRIDTAKTARRIGLMLDGIFHASASRRDNRIAEDIRDLGEFVDVMLAPQPHMA
ncbi:TetR/AcrR family transcriptional regulator [Ancylobacter pratisalsi]|uniref:TetR/AcrR family transcriptional regulator n=1 Tax=Ancylobacter pratisalsi TaxID=1745854 RepID=A0A6P1YN44_9HYPH|nr:TetR/AcrR family transcriptional regulator [Ancylobacter pratisalsi]QIB34126.1 TetR/AcrR family transcriptional regulator [Ancylobacter pratisalsi]